MILFDRSRYEAYLDCPRLRYWQYEFKGKGIVPKTMNVPQSTGSMIHAGMAYLAAGHDLEKTVSLIHSQYDALVAENGLAVDTSEDLQLLCGEQKAIAEGLLRAWHRVRKPLFDDQYEVISVEQEQLVALDNDVKLMVRRDCVVRNRKRGGIYVYNWKSFSYIPSDWEQVWEHSTSRLSELCGLHDLVNPFGFTTEIEGVIVEGFYKGRKVEGRLSSPLLNAYLVPPASSKKSNFKLNDLEERVLAELMVWREKIVLVDKIAKAVGAPSEEVISNIRLPLLKLYAEDCCPVVYHTEWKQGLQKIDAWRQIGVKKWIDFLPDEVLLKQFVTTLPLVLDVRRLASWVQQACAVEKKVASAGTDIDTEFPQNFHHCHRYNEAPCAYVKCCFNGQVSEDPIASGYYKWREPHHSTEGDIE